MKADDVMKEIEEESQDKSMVIDTKKGKNGRREASPTYKNALIWLNTDVNLIGLFVYNEFASKLEISRKPPWHDKARFPKQANDFDTLSLKTYMLETYECEFNRNILVEAVDNYAKTNSYDPVLDYLKDLKWDGVPRLDKWLTTYLGVEPTKYSRTVGRMVLAAACARADRPGIKFDFMLILEGRQDLGKSVAVKVLGGEWYKTISLVDKTKDSVEKMQGAWLIEVSEMACFNKKDIESLKAFITTEVDTERLPYGRRSMEFPRRNVFIGTINPNNSGYLTDTTGNRRFLPVECSAVDTDNDTVDLKGLKRDRNQIWAEAWGVYKGGIKLWMDKEMTDICREEQSDREIIDEWQDPIEQYLMAKDQTTSVDVYTNAIKGFVTDFNRLAQMRVADCMKRLGWKRQVIRVNSKPVKGFVRSRASSEVLESSELPWE